MPQLLVQTRPHELRFASLDGRRAGRLEGFDLASNPGEPVQLRDRDGRRFLLDWRSGRLKRLARGYRGPGTELRLPAGCDPGPRAPDGLYLLCRGAPATVELLSGGRPRVLVHGPGKVGHWAGAFVSPDRRTLLLQWSAECEVPIAFFARSVGGGLRVVSGERDWTRAPTSVALGWAQDGRAVVEFPEGVCSGGRDRPGVYAVDARSLRARLVLPLPRRARVVFRGSSA